MAGPPGTRPARIHATRAGSISTTVQERTLGSSSTARAVNPSPKPPTRTSPGAGTAASAAVASARSVLVCTESMT